MITWCILRSALHSWALSNCSFQGHSRQCSRRSNDGASQPRSGSYWTPPEDTLPCRPPWRTPTLMRGAFRIPRWFCLLRYLPRPSRGSRTTWFTWTVASPGSIHRRPFPPARRSDVWTYCFRITNDNYFVFRRRFSDKERRFHLGYVTALLSGLTVFMIIVLVD